MMMTMFLSAADADESEPSSFDWSEPPAGVPASTPPRGVASNPTPCPGPPWICDAVE
jgi:hypothetical protein